MEGFDPARVSRAVAGALAGPGGVALVVSVFAGVPGVVRTPARRGMFRSQPERIQIGDWRYEVTSDFTVFRQRDKAPKQLKAGLCFSAHEPLGNPVILEIGFERFEAEKGKLLAHTITIPTIN